MGFEPTTSSMPSRRAPNCATAPPGRFSDVNIRVLHSSMRVRCRGVRLFALEQRTICSHRRFKKHAKLTVKFSSYLSDSLLNVIVLALVMDTL